MGYARNGTILVIFYDCCVPTYLIRIGIEILQKKRT